MPIGRYCCDHAPRTARSMAQMTTQHFRSLFDIAHHFQALQGPRGAALRRIFKCTGKNAKCLVGEELSAKYNVKQDNEQFLVSVTNRSAPVGVLVQNWQPQHADCPEFSATPSPVLAAATAAAHTEHNSACQLASDLSYQVCLACRYTLEQTWFNESRTQKPQTFKQVHLEVASEYQCTKNLSSKQQEM
eukprot:GHRR01008638.1.p1 GENE.GHRR01008638.1~~GHRR01008638.1.p1  ORF type:complete len:189 (+),score=35.25 GHRR01008638.1:585-1151(+)